MVFLPTFQAQNPAISGYRYGWSSCTAFAAAMVASYDQQVPKHVTGAQVRNQTGDFSGGLNLSQIDESLQHFGVDLSVRYRLPWDDYVELRNAGRAAVISVGYRPIAHSRYDAGGGFQGNHAMAEFVDEATADPLADGRRAGIYKYRAEKYPDSLIKEACGELDLGGGRRLGDGLVYAALSHDRVAPGEAQWYATVRPGGTAFMAYTIGARPDLPAPHLQVRGRRRVVTKSGFSLRCTAPYWVWERPAGDGTPNTQRNVVRIIAGSYAGTVIDRKWAGEK